MNASNYRRHPAARSIGLVVIGLLAAATHTRAFASKVVIPAGTPVTLELVEPLSSETSHKGDAVQLRLAEDLIVNGKKVLPAGARASGAITVAQPRGRLARQGRLGFEVATLEAKGKSVAIRVSRPEAAPAEGGRGRRFLSRLASPLKRVAHNVVATADLDLVDARATAVARQGNTNVNGLAGRALELVDPLAGVELGTDGRGTGAMKRGVRSLERVGTGYVVSILSGPAGLMRRGASVDVPAGATVHAVTSEDITL